LNTIQLQTVHADFLLTLCDSLATCSSKCPNRVKSVWQRSDRRSFIGRPRFMCTCSINVVCWSNNCKHVSFLSPASSFLPYHPLASLCSSSLLSYSCVHPGLPSPNTLQSLLAVPLNCSAPIPFPLSSLCSRLSFRPPLLPSFVTASSSSHCPLISSLVFFPVHGHVPLFHGVVCRHCPIPSHRHHSTSTSSLCLLPYLQPHGTNVLCLDHRLYRWMARGIVQVFGIRGYVPPFSSTSLRPIQMLTLVQGMTWEPI
jgi:hypothetical protein